jgi:hypothetical protein
VNVNATRRKRLKANYLNNLHDVPFADHDFQEMLRSGNTTDLRSHSIRKYTATWSKINGCTMEEIDTVADGSGTQGEWLIDTLASINHTSTRKSRVYCVLVVQSNIPWLTTAPSHQSG